jgi:hypothetical protein
MRRSARHRVIVPTAILSRLARQLERNPDMLECSESAPASNGSKRSSGRKRLSGRGMSKKRRTYHPRIVGGKPDITLRIYAHLFRNDDSKAAAAIDAALARTVAKR